MLVDESSDTLVIKISQDARGVRFPKGMGIAGHVVTTKQTLVIEDAYSDPRFNPDGDAKTGFVTRNILCHPLLIPTDANEPVFQKDAKEDTVSGIIQLVNKRNGFQFTPVDLRRMDVFATEVSRILHQKRLELDVSEDPRFITLSSLEQPLRIKVRQCSGHGGPIEVQDSGSSVRQVAGLPGQTDGLLVCVKVQLFHGNDLLADSTSECVNMYYNIDMRLSVARWSKWVDLPLNMSDLPRAVRAIFTVLTERFALPPF